MSIQSEINRIKTDKENLITALEAKGATIADGATLGDISLDVEEIEVGINTSDATASADEIFSGETAYVNGSKVTGNFTIDSEITTQENLISQISTLVQTKANPQGGTDTSDATATASDILSGKTAYVKGTKITGNIASQAAKTIIPTTIDQVAVLSGNYVTGDITVIGDSNLIAENIKSGISIFGINGSYEGSNSGSIETVTGIFRVNGPSLDDSLGGTVYYVNGSGDIAVSNLQETVTVAKNTMLVGISDGNGISVNEGLTIAFIYSNANKIIKIYKVIDNFAINI